MELSNMFSLPSIRFAAFTAFLLSLNAVVKTDAAGAWGDPHFTGWDSVHFDFTGEPGSIYCMLSDPNLHINMQMDGRMIENSNETRTWIKSLGVLFGNHRIILSALSGDDLSHSQTFMGEISADGDQVHLPINRMYNSADGRVSLSYDKKIEHAVMPHDTYTLSLKGAARMRITVSPEIPDMREEGDAFFHLSFEFLEADLSPSVHGVLGQTHLNSMGRLQKNSYKMIWNRRLLVQQVEGPNGDGYLDGSSSDYVSSDLLHSDCSFSRFDSNFESNNPRIVEVLSGYNRKVYPGGFHDLHF
ncbi:hypothetical protein O6H91_04G006400 [Diphasiastrum complanatum]|uniref:Uncharacterized protein n=1 Tax=Diphasiastrum complanatum TaxID=34168 RepID=A0ACC2DTT4_DIPCM|nr:hypothetical protein O6H91_04G006400 [Diphasiastrum complanatum]